MDSATALLLLCATLAASTRSAPVGSPADTSPAFGEAAERAKLLVEKILRDIPTVHAATVTSQVLTLDSSHTSGLQTLAASLGVPAVPALKPLSERFPLDVCVARMWAGSRQYQGLVAVLSGRLSGLTELNSDLRDLLTHIAKMKEAARIDDPGQTVSLDLESRLHGEYEVQVAVHVTLTQIRSFCHDLMRSLRAVAPHRSRTASSR